MLIDAANFLSKPGNYGLITLVFVVLLVADFFWNKSRRNKYVSSWTVFTRTVSSVFLFAAIILSLIVVNIFFTIPDFDSAEKKIKAGHQLNDKHLLALGYEQLALEGNATGNDYSKLIDYHFECKNSNDSALIPGYLYNTSTNTLAERFRSGSGNSSENNLTSLAILYLKKNDPDQAVQTLLKVRDTKQALYNQVTGLLYLQYQDSLSAINFFKKEIEIGGDSSAAYSSLFSLIEFKKDKHAINEYISNPEITKFLDPNQIKDIQLKNGYHKNYLNSFFKIIRSKIKWSDLLAASWVALAWFFYLLFLDPNRNKNGLRYILLLLTAVGLSFCSPVISDVLRIKTGFFLNGELMNDLIYSVIGIGLIEEAIKMLPLMIPILFFKRPIQGWEYLIMGSISALGFAFSENLIYYEPDSLNLIHARALITTVAHMFFTASGAYLFFIMYCRKKYGILVSFLSGLIMAAFIHGAFDFWLVNPIASKFSAITIIIYVAGLYAWVIMFNKSFSGNTEFKIPAIKLQFYLVSSLSSIFLLEYILTGFYYGPGIANQNMNTALQYGGYLLIFLSTSLSSIKSAGNKID